MRFDTPAALGCLAAVPAAMLIGKLTSQVPPASGSRAEPRLLFQAPGRNAAARER